MTSVEETVRETIRTYDMIRPGEKILVGFSGGADSVCLLQVLSALSDGLSFSLHALHVHHGLRGEAADRDAAFTEEFCRERDIPYTCVKVDVKSRALLKGESLEEAARALRYEALYRTAEACGAAKIALAHHRNDSAETVLFHMIRGSGLRGLSGIPPVRGNIIRPLLFVTRSEILSELSRRKISYCTDETNDSDDASRNMLRHYAIPALAAVRRDAAVKIADTGAYLGEVDRYLTEEAEELLRENPAPDGNGIPASVLLPAKSILREYLVSTFLRDRGFSMKDVRREHLQSAAALSEKPAGKTVMLPGGVRAVRTRDSVVFYGPGEEAENVSEASDPLAGLRMDIRIFDRPADAEIPEKEYTKWFDYDKIKNVPLLRTRSSGDRIAVRPSMHQKLKDWMINEKIPREERDRVPLVCDGSDVLWAVGYRMDADHGITPETARIMEITVTTVGGENA